MQAPQIISPRPPRRRAFTLIELLVVVALIAALITILVPSLSRVKRQSLVAAAKTEMHSIQQGMQQYYIDFHMYPPSSGSSGYLGVPNRGSAMLAQGLVGYLPFDKDGGGPTVTNGSASSAPSDPAYCFRTRVPAMIATMGAGQPSGPYMQTDPSVLRVAADNSPSSGKFDQTFIDPWGHEILYYLAQAPTAAKIFDQASNNDSIFSIDDNNSIQPDGTRQFNNPPPAPVTALDPSGVGPGAGNKLLQLINDGTNTPNGIVTGADSFLLISPGPDNIYFSTDDIAVGKN